MNYLPAILLLTAAAVLFLFAACAGRQPVMIVPENKPAGQAYELESVVTKCATGAAVAGALTVVVSIVLKSPTVAVAGIAGATTLGGIPLLLQQATAWIPWIVAAILVGLTGWLIFHNRKLSALWVKDRAKLKQVYDQASDALPPVGQVIAGTAHEKTLINISNDLLDHLK